MKILQIANGDFFSTFGGGQIYVKNLVDEMIQQGVNVTIFSLLNNGNEDAIQRKEYRGVPLFEINTLNTESIKEAIGSLSPDIVHIHAEKGYFSKLCNESNIPNIVTAHHGGIVCPAGALLNYKDEICHIRANPKDCLPCLLRSYKLGIQSYPLMKILPLSLRLGLSKLFKRLPFIYFVTPIMMASGSIASKQNEWESIVNNADLIIAPSDAIKNSMIINGLSDSKITVIPHGIPRYEFVGVSENSGRLSDAPLKFFFLGRICHIKGVHILLDAFNRLLSVNCEIHLIGSTNNSYAQKLIKKYKQNSRIIFHGEVLPNEISGYIRQFDVLIHSTICMEIFGLNIAEALQEGKPVIATRCGGAEMQIIEGENGWLVPPNEVQPLKDAMDWMISHREAVVKMSEKAPERVNSMQNHVSDLLVVYERVSNLYQKKIG